MMLIRHNINSSTEKVETVALDERAVQALNERRNHIMEVLQIVSGGGRSVAICGVKPGIFNPLIV